AWHGPPSNGVPHGPAKGSQKNGRPGLATTRAGSLARVTTNSPCQRGAALLKLKVHPVVPTRRGVRDRQGLRKHRKRFPTPPQLHCLTADQRRGSYSLPAPATQSRQRELGAAL